MDSKIIAAIITGVCTLLATLLAWFLKNMSEYRSISKERKRAITGSWRGITNQQEGPLGIPIEVDLVITFKTIFRKIKGTSRVKGGGDELDVTLSGGYKDSGYISLSYKSQDPNKLNFGCLLLKLNGDGNQLTGKIIGYGNKSEKLINGDMILNKVY